MPDSVRQVVAGAAAIILSTILTVTARGIYRWARRLERLIRALPEHDRILTELTSMRKELTKLRSEVERSGTPANHRRHGGPVKPVRRQDPDG